MKSRSLSIRLRRPGLAPAAGFTLIEVLVASVVIVVGMLSMFGLLDATSKASLETHTREGATTLARGILEDARTIPYSQLSPSSIDNQLEAMPGLKSESESIWQLKHGTHAYTISVTECAIDEGADGYGRHLTKSLFCADSSQEYEGGPRERFDSTPEDSRRITAEVSWLAHGQPRHVKLVETLTSAGAAPGLSAHGLHLSESSETEIKTEPASERLTFAVTSPEGTTAMRWSLEGVPQTPDPVQTSGTTTWTFSWPIPLSSVSDGTYQVSVQAIDASGVAGPPVSMTITLNRSHPAAPSEIAGGFNTVYAEGVKNQNVVELEWRANTERNIVGYRVYDPTHHLVCPENMETLSTALSCIDFSPPKPTSPKLTFSVVALYYGHPNLEGKRLVEEGPAGELTVQGGPPPPPNPPSALNVVKNPNGSVTLSWTPPVGGPEVAFYRVYRGSTDYTSRYSEVLTTAAPTFTDTDAEVIHEYWVTAVNKNLTESTFLGPASG
jgi:prepilin-type N-terminal cleavage/methylation domain-containing protein